MHTHQDRPPRPPRVQGRRPGGGRAARDGDGRTTPTSARPARLTSAQLFHLGEAFDAKQHLQAILRLQPQPVPALALSGGSSRRAENEINGVKFASEWGFGAATATRRRSSRRRGRRSRSPPPAASATSTPRWASRALPMKENHREALDHSPSSSAPTRFLPALVEKAWCCSRWATGSRRSRRRSAPSPGRHRPPRRRRHRRRPPRPRPHALRRSRTTRAARRPELSHALDRHEPMNAPLYFRSRAPLRASPAALHPLPHLA